MKKLLNEWVLQLLGSAAFIAGLFAFALLCGVFLMDYDPQTMIEGIARDLRNVFE